MGVGVGSGVGLGVGSGVALGVGVGSGAGVGVGVGVGVGMGVGVGVAVGSGVATGVGVGVAVSAGAGVAVGVGSPPQAHRPNANASTRRPRRAVCNFFMGSTFFLFVAIDFVLFQNKLGDLFLALLIQRKVNIGIDRRLIVEVVLAIRHKQAYTVKEDV